MSQSSRQLRRARALVRAFGGGLPRNFWKLWGSSVSANVADGILLVTLPLIAVRLTSSPAEVAGVAVAFQLPMIIFGLIAGGLADRLDRRWTMLAVAWSAQVAEPVGRYSRRNLVWVPATLALGVIRQRATVTIERSA